MSTETPRLGRSLEYSLPPNPNGLSLRYNGLTIKVIDSDSTHIVCLFPSGSKHCFGRGGFSEKDIDNNLANKTIKKNHYSKKVYNATYIHLGVFINSEFLGVLQYGYAMNPASCSSVVEGTEMNQYLELNRMWLSDKAGRNSESTAISYSIKYIKGKYPRIKWIQSFADERCGCFGIVYQACSFSFYGEHISDFWELNGVVYHNIQMTVSKDSKRYGGEAKILQENRDKAKRMSLRQFRYIKFIDQRWKSRCLLKEMPYPKHYNETEL